MEVLTLIVLLVVVVGLAGIFWFLKTSLVPENKKEDQALLMLQSQLAEVRSTLDAKLGESSRAVQGFMQNQSSESVKIIRDVTERLTKLDETNRQVVNFADQLQNLQDILKNPKQRGILGEY